MTPEKTEVFVSYSMHDKKFIDPFMRRFQRNFKPLLYDDIEEPKGKIRDDLRAMQRRAAGTIVFWTKEASRSERIKDELDTALSYSKDSNSGKFLVVIVGEDGKLPELTGVPTFNADDMDVDTIMTSIDEIVSRYDDWSPHERSVSAKEKSNANADEFSSKSGPATTTSSAAKQNAPPQGSKEKIAEEQHDQKEPINYSIFKLKEPLQTENYETVDWDSIIFDFKVATDTGEYKVLPIIKGERETIPILLRLDLQKGLVVEEQFRYPIGVEEIKQIDPRMEEIFSFPTWPKFESIDEEFAKQIIKFGREGSKDKIKKPFVNPYVPFYLSEGDHKDTQDQLQFENDINSFASVITLKKVKPPLAVGLFGNWGSGKSFFMEKLYQKIKIISGNEKDADSVHNVVQVKFNSWHYSDSNLWASLITQIFDSLEKFAREKGKVSDFNELSDNLQITSIQKAALETKRVELETSIAQLEQQQIQKRERLEDLSGFALVKLILSDKMVQGDLASLVSSNNIENLQKAKKQLSDYSDHIKDASNQINAIWQFIKGMKGWRWFIVLLILSLAASLPYFLPILFPNWAGFIPKLTAAIAVLVAAGKLIYPGLHYVQVASKRLKSMQDTLNNRSVQGSGEAEQKIIELKQVTAELQEVNNKLENARKEVDDLKSGKKLLEFIEQRTRDENYARQLGLISWIRKDFEMLDDLLRKQYEMIEEEQAKKKDQPANDKENKTDQTKKEKLRIDRIILYIDDLDRCKEEIVIRVLEAIHLLLAFPLFVVVVGVDPRWLNNALTEIYKTLFGSSAAKANGDTKIEAEKLLLSGAATSYDYLEKIFQIPFTLKPIDKPGRENLIAYLLKNEMKPDSTNEAQTNAKTDTTAANVKDENIKNAAPPILGNDGSNGTQQKTGAHQGEVDVLQEKKKIALTFSKEEKEFMQTISPIFGHTPRGINRYVNIYRIIKAHKSLKVDDDFSEDEFTPIMIVLSVIVGFSVHAQKFMELLTGTGNDTTFKKFLETKELKDDLRSALSKYIAPEFLELPVECFKKNLELISRFSFRTLVN